MIDKTVRRYLRFTQALTVCGVVVLGARSASANNINVDTANTNFVSGDGKCGLREAIEAVNTGAAYDHCGAPNGVGDSITLTAAGPYVATGAFVIQRSVRIIGKGVALTTIRSNFTAGTELFYVVEGNPVPPTTVSFEGLNIEATVGQAAPTVTGIYANSSTTGGVWVKVLSSRVAGFTWTGIYSDGVDIEVHDSTIENNTSPTAGAGVSVNNVPAGDSNGARAGLNIYESTITGNVSETNGGGIFYGGSGNSHLDNSTVSYNTAKSGGGGGQIQAASDYFQIDNSTIAFNTAFNTGGGFSSSSGNIYVFGSIVDGNAAHANVDWDGYITSLGQSLVGDSFGLTVNSESDPNLYDVDANLDSTLLDLGGAYHTKVHRLLPGSPAIDFYAGSGGLDQRHFPRGIEGDGVSGPNLNDMGACEMDPKTQTETMLVAAKSSDTHSVVTSSGYSNGSGTNLQSNAANDFVTYAVPVAQAGTYNIRVGVRKGSNRGKFQLGVSPSPSGPFTAVGAVQDLYSTTSPFVELNVSASTSLSAGQVYFRFLVTGKASASSSYQLFLDYIKF